MEDCANQPNQLPIYKMRDEDEKLIYQRESQDISEDAAQQEPEPENPQLTQEEANILCTEQNQDTTSIHSEIATQVIFEDQETHFDILMHNYMNLQTDGLPGTESSGEHEVITLITSDPTVDQPTISDTECAGPELPRKARKKDISPKKSEEIHSKTAKAVELLFKQTIAKNPKAHYYNKKV